MKKYFFPLFLSIFVLMTNNVRAQLDAIEDNPLSPRIANYQITAQLNIISKKIEGQLLLSWKNTSKDTLTELQFHLYMNAFKNTKSTFMQESGGDFRGGSMDNLNHDFGEININALKIDAGKDIASTLKYIQPDDENQFDQTVVSLPLKEPLFPGKSIDVEMQFTTKLPKIIARTGFANNYYLVGQWFPKIGVYQNNHWNCHQFHANSEFFADFGTYIVSITIPQEYKIGATGLKIKETHEPKKGTKTYLFRAEDVVDFAWTCSPKFIEIRDHWRYVDIFMLMQPEHKKQAKRQIDALKAAFEYFDRHLGRYPYPQLTVVDPPIQGLNSGGMEYPAFITVGTLANLPKKVNLSEVTAIHEFGHQYFMGILASNEFEEPWLDEGLNSYLESRITDDYYKNKPKFFFSLSNVLRQRLSYISNPNNTAVPTASFAWKFPEGTYGTLVYAKTATFMNTLERFIGKETMDIILKKYYNDFKFKHPTAKDFIDIVSLETIKKYGIRYGKDMNWFFDQVLYKSGTCDYAADRISNKLITKAQGSFSLLNPNPPTDEGMYKCEAFFSRKGEIKMPIDILIVFEDGQTRTKYWNGNSRTKKFTFKSTTKISKIIIDPERILLIDTNFLNNSKVTHKKEAGIWKYVLKVLFFLQNIMQSVSFLA